MENKQIELLYRRMTLKIGINRFLRRNSGRSYYGQVRKNFTTVTDEYFAEVVEEMVREQSVVRLDGQRGSVILQQILVIQKEATNG